MSIARLPKTILARILARIGLLGCYTCPICGESSRFDNFSGREHACCWHCGSLERHRGQYVVLQEYLKNFSPTDSTAIQFAPDAMTPFLRQYFQNFETADLYRENVDLNLDLRNLALDDETYDFLFASHVMEHVDDDMTALNEIYRVLKPGGLACILHE
jgi:SAM-dependent methyltransferase